MTHPSYPCPRHHPCFRSRSHPRLCSHYLLLDHPDYSRDNASDTPGGDVCRGGAAGLPGRSYLHEEHGE